MATYIKFRLSQETSKYVEMTTPNLLHWPSWLVGYLYSVVRDVPATSCNLEDWFSSTVWAVQLYHLSPNLPQCKSDWLMTLLRCGLFGRAAQNLHYMIRKFVVLTSLGSTDHMTETIYYNKCQFNKTKHDKVGVRETWNGAGLEDFHDHQYCASCGPFTGTDRSVIER